jgi:hypothetical protein
VLGMKAADVVGVARDERGRDELGEFQNRELFGVVAERSWRVEHLGALALRSFEHVRGVEVLAVKRRVFAHDDCVKVFEQLGALVGVGLRRVEPVVA